MATVQADAEGGINRFVADQAAEPGHATLTLVQFDTTYEFVHKAVPVKDVPRYELVPRGCTALLDAVGRAVFETGERLAAMNEADRPGLVVFVIVTDGHENSSKEFTRAKVKEMIERQTNDYKWKFIYLGANQDAFAEAGGIGIGAACTANYAEQKTSGAILLGSDKVKYMRAAAASGESVSCSFSDEDRVAMSE